MAVVVGVDGCRKGWFAVSLTPETSEIVSAVFPTAKNLCESLTSAVAIAVDVPIGLTDSGPRECDREARKVLGRPRASSVFPAPVRAALAAKTRQEASGIQERIDGRRIGRQAWGILPKIREWDSFLRANPPIAKRVFEVHPEVCFWALNKFRSMQHNKKTQEGHRERRRLLAQVFGAKALDDVKSRHLRHYVADDDLLDAFAALWTAQRIHTGEVSRLPESPLRDSAGLPMTIWY